MNRKIGIIFLLGLGLVACGKSDKNNSANGGTNGGTQGGGTAAGSGPQVRFIGRVTPDNNGNAVLSWPGTAVEVHTSATQLSVKMSLIASVTNAQSAAIAVMIDGTQTGRIQLDPATTSYPIAGLDGKGHSVMLVKATEAADGDIQFGGFEGALDANSATPPTRLIEFIGDSITAGFDIEGPAGNPAACPGDVYPFASDPNLTNAASAYAVLTAQGFDADWSIIAYSGRGVYQNRDGTLDTSAEHTVPGLWSLTNANQPGTMWSFAQQPNLVVINLGTNDFAATDSSTTVGKLPDQTGFVSTYADFLKAINSKYPNATIVATIGPMLSDNQTIGGKPQLTTAKAYINAAIAASGLQNVSFFAYTPNNGQWTCDYHPDKAEAQIMAQQLHGFISTTVSGWE